MLLDKINFESQDLFLFIAKEDQYLLESEGNRWFKILTFFPWQLFKVHAADYYNALADFNSVADDEECTISEPNAQESKDEAKLRILKERDTMKPADEKQVLFNESFLTPARESCKAEGMEPGYTPNRIAGRSPKCFFAMLKAFLGVGFMGEPAVPEIVDRHLRANPSFARVCGFTYPDNGSYRNSDIPSLRKLEQFDQIMEIYGIWHKIKADQVCRNLEDGIIELEKDLVGDTTHYYADSQFETVQYVDDKGKKQKKSQCKVTKNCRCEDWDTCEHDWVPADDGAGTIVKSSNRMHWGHKASVVGFPAQGIPLDMRTVQDAATHDGETFLPHVEYVFEQHPEVKNVVDRILYDSACDSDKLRKQIENAPELEVELYASLNPRRKQAITEGLPKGMKKLTPYGSLICIGDHEMEYSEKRADEQYVYGDPLDESGNEKCLDCPFKNQCTPNSKKGRTVNISINFLPHINPQNPPMAKRFKKKMKLRPSVERMIKILKCDCSSPYLKKRGNSAFQAYLDKSMIVFHMQLRL